MKEKIIYLEAENEKYPLAFNVNVMEEIQNEYGSISRWGNIVENKDSAESEPKIKDLKVGMLFMVNEGIEIENEKSETKRKLLNSKQLGRLLSKIGLKEVIEKIKEVSINSTTVEDDNLKNE